MFNSTKLSLITLLFILQVNCSPPPTALEIANQKTTIADQANTNIWTQTHVVRPDVVRLELSDFDTADGSTTQEDVDNAMTELLALKSAWSKQNPTKEIKNLQVLSGHSYTSPFALEITFKDDPAVVTQINKGVYNVILLGINSPKINDDGQDTAYIRKSMDDCSGDEGICFKNFNKEVDNSIAEWQQNNQQKEILCISKVQGGKYTRIVGAVIHYKITTSNTEERK